MPHSVSRPLLARLRASTPPRLHASTYLAALVLMVFVMKIGMVAACTAQDLENASLDGQTNISASLAVSADGAATDDGKSPSPLEHAGDCVDCHHAVALLPDTASLAWVPVVDESAGALAHVHLAAPRRELRPPIA